MRATVEIKGSFYELRKWLQQNPIPDTALFTLTVTWEEENAPTHPLILEMKRRHSRTLPLETVGRLQDLMKSTQKIQAIKELRAATGLCLKEAKDFIDTAVQNGLL